MDDVGLRDSDAALVARCLKGHRRSFGELVRRYQKVLFNLALRMVGNEEDARDLTQAAFLKIYQNLSSYDPEYRFFSWIYRIALNESLNFLKRRRPTESLVGDELDERARPERPHEEAQLARGIQAAMMRLSPDYREVIFLRHFLDLSYREIGELAGIPEKTVKSRLFTARRQMGEFLQRAGVAG